MNLNFTHQLFFLINLKIMSVQFSTKSMLSILCFFAFIGITNAQDILLEETFDGEIPATWTNVEVVGNGQPSSVWVHTTTGPAGPFATDPLSSTTAGNGWVIFDSDLNCNDPEGQDAWLISPALDATGMDVVFLSFETYYRSFNDQPKIRVGTDLNDLASWGAIEVFPGVESNEFGGIVSGNQNLNPQEIAINLTEFAAGESTFYFAFQFESSSSTGNGGNLTGCGYNWQVDDVVVINEDLRPANDLQVNQFHAVSPNVAVPASQVSPFGFIADVSNVGSEDQTNATLTMTIDDGSSDVFTDAVDYPEIASDETIENVFFDNEFTPPAEANVLYTGTYSLELDGEEDENPDNNTQTFEFAVTDTLYQKDSGTGLVTILPADDNDFRFGNVFYAPNGDGLNVRYVSFALGNPEDLGGTSVTTYLYEWDGVGGEDFSLSEDEIGDAIAFNFYEIDGTEDGLITIPVSLDNEFPEMKDDHYYIIVVEFAPDDDDTDNRLLASNDLDYTAMNFYQDSVGNADRYAVALDVGNVNEYSLVGFGLDIVPVVRLSISSTDVATENQFLPTNSLKVFPTIADQEVWAEINLEDNADVLDIALISANGTIVRNLQLDNTRQDKVRFDVSQLTTGNYYLRLTTEDGLRSKPFMIQR